MLFYSVQTVTKQIKTLLLIITVYHCAIQLLNNRNKCQSVAVVAGWDWDNLSTTLVY